MALDDYTIVTTTVETEQQAEALARKIVVEKLAACVQIQKIKSVYSWNDKIELNDEHLLMIKTRSDLFAEISEFIKENHDYQVPEIVQIPITNGSNEYLSWIKKVTR
ncbi:divalent-cation tolerance protein CutA [Alphaproteobacteria bacterium]|nr:divalent-cation tolerance protein CutA [Alphaproteobacteria bacterium]